MRTQNVVVEKWNQKWKEEFEKIVESLGKEIIQNVIKIEHVGSTSVKGMSAKPIIDLDIVIENDKFLILKKLLEDKGYVHEGDLGIKDREAFSYINKNELMTHHLYVCPKDSEELFKHITFRHNYDLYYFYKFRLKHNITDKIVLWLIPPCCFIFHQLVKL